MKISNNFAFCILVLLTVMPLVLFLSKYLPYRIKAKLATSASQKFTIGPTIVSHLQQLTGIPVIGQLFYEDKIYYLSLLGNWQRVIKESETALETFANENSFQIWYYKGVAQCILKNFEKCEESALTAFYLSSRSVIKKQIVEGLLQHMANEKRKMQFQAQQTLTERGQLYSEYAHAFTQARVIYKQSLRQNQTKISNQYQQNFGGYVHVYNNQNGNECFGSLIEL